MLCFVALYDCSGFVSFVEFSVLHMFGGRQGFPAIYIRNIGFLAEADAASCVVCSRTR